MTTSIHTVIAETKKGHRIWLEKLGAHGWSGGTTYTTTYTDNLIIYTKATEGKLRTVTASKGGIIDTVSKKVTAWAQGATECVVVIDSDTIYIGREG